MLGLEPGHYWFQSQNLRTSTPTKAEVGLELHTKPRITVTGLSCLHLTAISQLNTEFEYFRAACLGVTDCGVARGEKEMIPAFENRMYFTSGTRKSDLCLVLLSRSVFPTLSTLKGEKTNSAR